MRLSINIFLLTVVLMLGISGCIKEEFAKGNFAFGYVYDSESGKPLENINVNFISSVSGPCIFQGLNQNCIAIRHSVKTDKAGYFEIKINRFLPGFSSVPMLYIVDDEFVYNEKFLSLKAPINEYKIFLDKKTCDSLKVKLKIVNSWQANNNDTLFIRTNCGNYSFIGIVDTTIECSVFKEYKFLINGYFSKVYNNNIKEDLYNEYILKCNQENKFDIYY